VGAVVGSAVSGLQPSERVTELIGELSAGIFEPQSFWSRRSSTWWQDFGVRCFLYWSLFEDAVWGVVGSAVTWLQPSERVTELIGDVCLGSIGNGNHAWE
jgi:hypothetical protein